MRPVRAIRVGPLLAILLALAVGLDSPAGAQPSPSPTAPAPVPTLPAPVPTLPAAPTLPADMTDTLSRLTKNIESAEKSIQHIKELEDDLGRLRTDVESILSGSTDTADTLRPRLAEVKGQIAKLGPAPAKDQPAESPDVAAERARLNQQAASLDGAIKSAELTWVRARQLIERITVMRHALFTKSLLERLPSPLLPVHWRDMWQAMPGVVQRIQYLGEDWWGWARPQLGLIVGLLIAAALLYALLRAAIERLTRARAATHADPTTFFERAGAVAWTAPLRMLPGIASALLLYAGFDALDLTFPPWERMASGLLRAAIVFIVASAIIRTVFAPRRSQWRLVPLSDASARRIVHWLQIVTAIYAADAALTEINRAFFIPLAVTVVQSFLVSVTSALALIAILLTPFAAPGVALADAPRHRPRWIKVPLWGLALAIVAASVLGYIALARFMAQQLVLTGIVLGVTGLLYLAIRAVTREAPRTDDTFGAMLESRFGLDAPRRGQLAWLAEVTLTFGLALLALPVLLLQWGFSFADIRDWVTAALFGFEVGHFRISLARIFIGIALFTVLVAVTRFIQRLLRERVLQSARFDPGIANSIDMTAGYLGIAIAALIAVSYAGFDVTNLAIVAGALSVGIGFGLQSIVNNFVSGLILLIERPIKVGDFIVVGGEQGNVRRISVRATEIETFDRASLIVPNSELITARVLNWTHRNLLGRSIFKVAVDPNADPRRVIEILLAAASAHPTVLSIPAPSVSIDSIGPNTLDFSLRITLADFSTGGGVPNDVKIAILEGLRAAGIVMPNPKYDIFMRDLDALKKLALQVMEQRQREQAAAGLDPVNMTAPKT